MEKSKIKFFNTNKIKALVFLFFLLIGCSLAVNLATANNGGGGNTDNPVSELQKGLETAAKEGTLGEANADLDIDQLIITIVNTAFSVLGGLTLILIIYAGFLYMTAAQQGKEDQINRAKKVLQYAIVGLLLVFGSYAITNQVLKIVINSQ